MYQVVKRDGQIAEFDIHKIGAAIQKAFEASGKNFHPSVIASNSTRYVTIFHYNKD